MTPVADLRSLTLDELAGMFGAADDELREAISAECDRRDKADRDRRRRRANPETEAWREMAHAQYLAAESETAGNLLNARGRAAGIDAWSLWQGPMWQAERHASWELLRYWEQHPRITISEYRRQAAAARAAEQDERERAATELPALADLVAMVREHGPAALDQYPAAMLDELLDAELAASWTGVKVTTIYVDTSRGRWPAPDATEGRSKRWSRRTIVVALAARHGLGAPGRTRAKRK